MVTSLSQAGSATLANRWPVVLCVDDDPNIIASMERSFYPYEIKFDRAYHGMQGIMTAVTIRPDVILTDLQMPLATGEELIECLTRNPITQNTPMIVITGRQGAKLTSRLRQLGVIAVMGKPVQFESLLEELSKVIDVKRRRR